MKSTNLFKAPLSSADACEILDRLEDGVPLHEIVVHELVEPISEWIDEVNCIENEGKTNE